MFQIEVDDFGIIVATTSGFWSVATADAYRREFGRYLQASRSRRGYALSLVDGRENQVQPRDVMEALVGIEALTIATDRDRSALIVPSSLAKIQAQRLIQTMQAMAFLSLSAARTWLLAYEEVSSKPACAS